MSKDTGTWSTRGAYPMDASEADMSNLRVFHIIEADCHMGDDGAFSIYYTNMALDAPWIPARDARNGAQSWPDFMA